MDFHREYREKLTIDNFTVPDAFAHENRWLEEEDGKVFWPMVMYGDIFVYLMFYPSELKIEDLSDYKTKVSA